MSKIYEALQRAEQERLASNANASATALAQEEPAADLADETLAPTPLPPLQPVLQTQPRQAPPPDLLPIPLQAPLSSLAEPTYELPAMDPALAKVEPAPNALRPASPPRPFDLSAIPTVEWKPLFDKLPSLGERGAAVEQFRSLRTRLIAFRDLNKLKTLLISSGLPREGKSFIAANLAISLARHKSTQVLLIDGDMRRSSLQVLFGTSKSPGLSTYLAGDATMEEIMQRPAIGDDGVPLLNGLSSLTFIPGGEEGDKSADLSGSPRFRQLLQRAAGTFDWIIVDSSPVNLVTDGVNLATACDAVLLVARGGVTRLEAAQRALTELKSSNVLGVVLNAVDDAPAAQGYYGYSSYASYDSIERKPDQTAQ